MSLLDEVDHPTGCSDDDVHAVMKLVDLRAQRGAAVHGDRAEIRRNPVELALNLQKNKEAFPNQVLGSRLQMNQHRSDVFLSFPNQVNTCKSVYMIQHHSHVFLVFYMWIVVDRFVCLTAAKKNHAFITGKKGYVRDERDKPAYFGAIRALSAKNKQTCIPNRLPAVIRIVILLAVDESQRHGGSSGKIRLTSRSDCKKNSAFRIFEWQQSMTRRTILKAVTVQYSRVQYRIPRIFEVHTGGTKSGTNRLKMPLVHIFQKSRVSRKRSTKRTYFLYSHITTKKAKKKKKEEIMIVVDFGFTLAVVICASRHGKNEYTKANNTLNLTHPPQKYNAYSSLLLQRG